MAQNTNISARPRPGPDPSPIVTNAAATPTVASGKSSPKPPPLPDHLAASIELLQKKPSLAVSLPPPELPHPTANIFPFATLLNRAAQQCWNDLNDLLNALAEPAAGKLPNGSAAAAQSSASSDPYKRSKILQFAQDKRNSFIKLLVLSQWSCRATDVRKMIGLHDLFFRLYQAYGYTGFQLGEIKRDLVRAQTGAPDFDTALRLLAIEPTQIAKTVRYVIILFSFSFRFSRSLMHMTLTLQHIRPAFYHSNL